LKRKKTDLVEKVAPEASRRKVRVGSSRNFGEEGAQEKKSGLFL